MLYIEAIHKNVNDLEEELNKFYNSFTSDQILPPKTAMAEAEGRIQTRLNVLVGLLISKVLYLQIRVRN